MTKLKHSELKKNSNFIKAPYLTKLKKYSLGINNLTPQQQMRFSEGSLLQPRNASVEAGRIYIFLQDAAGPVNRALHCKAWSTSRVNWYPDCIYKLWLDRVISGSLFILRKNLPSNFLSISLVNPKNWIYGQVTTLKSNSVQCTPALFSIFFLFEGVGHLIYKPHLKPVFVWVEINETIFFLHKLVSNTQQTNLRQQTSCVKIPKKIPDDPIKDAQSLSGISEIGSEI